MVNNVAGRNKQQFLIVSLMHESSDTCLFRNTVIVRHLCELVEWAEFKAFRAKQSSVRSQSQEKASHGAPARAAILILHCYTYPVRYICLAQGLLLSCFCGVHGECHPIVTSLEMSGPAPLSTELRKALGIGPHDPPPWLGEEHHRLRGSWADPISVEHLPSLTLLSPGTVHCPLTTHCVVKSCVCMCQ